LVLALIPLELKGYEFKYSEKITKAPKGWGVAYPRASFECINKDNYLKFVTGL